MATAAVIGLAPCAVGHAADAPANRVVTASEDAIRNACIQSLPGFGITCHGTNFDVWREWEHEPYEPALTVNTSTMPIAPDRLGLWHAQSKYHGYIDLTRHDEDGATYFVANVRVVQVVPDYQSYTLVRAVPTDSFTDLVWQQMDQKYPAFPDGILPSAEAGSPEATAFRNAQNDAKRAQDDARRAKEQAAEEQKRRQQEDDQRRAQAEAYARTPAGQAAQAKLNAEYVNRLRAKYGPRLHFQSARAEEIVRSFNIPCNAPDGRYLPLINVLYARLAQARSDQTWEESYVMTRGGETRVVDAMRGPRSQNADEGLLAIDINQWGELHTHGFSVEALMNACYGFDGPIWHAR